MAQIDGFHPAGVVGVGDPDHVVRVCQPNQFLRFVDEAPGYRSSPHHQMSAMWRTREGFAAQVAPDERMVVLPILRNGGPASYPESLRCHLWFVDRASGVGNVTLVDLLKSWLSQMDEPRTTEEFTRVIQFMLESSQVTVLRASG